MTLGTYVRPAILLHKPRCPQFLHSSCNGLISACQVKNPCHIPLFLYLIQSCHYLLHFLHQLLHLITKYSVSVSHFSPSTPPSLCSMPYISSQSVQYPPPLHFHIPFTPYPQIYLIVANGARPNFCSSLITKKFAADPNEITKHCPEGDLLHRPFRYRRNFMYLAECYKLYSGKRCIPGEGKRLGGEIVDVSLPMNTLIQLSEVHANADLAILLGD